MVWWAGDAMVETGGNEASSHDVAGASAAFVLYVEGYDFNVAQLTCQQQQIYYERFGRWLQELTEVDDLKP